MTDAEKKLLRTIEINAKLLDLWGKMIFLLVRDFKVNDDTVQLKELALNMRKRAKAMRAFVASFEEKPIRSMNILHKGLW